MLKNHKFNILTGRRRLSKMNSLVEKLSIADPELGTKLWSLVNAPVFINTINETYKKVEPNPEVSKYRIDIINAYLEDLEWALQRCVELEGNPTVKWHKLAGFGRCRRPFECFAG